MKILGKNKQSYRDYEILKEYECGIALLGWEVKSVRNGMFNLKESYVAEVNGELYIQGMHVKLWKTTTRSVVEKHQETRRRKLLLHKREILKLTLDKQKQGATIIPLQVYTKGNRIKLRIALAKGLRQYEKRDKLKQKDQNRSMERDLKKIGY